MHLASPTSWAWHPVFPGHEVAGWPSYTSTELGVTWLVYYRSMTDIMVIQGRDISGVDIVRIQCLMADNPQWGLLDGYSGIFVQALAGEFFGVNRAAPPAEVAQVSGHVIDH